MKQKSVKVSLVLICTVFCPFVLGNQLIAQLSCVTDAWDAFNRKDYKTAVESADRCIDDFGADADSAQAQLFKDKVPPPPFKRVSDADKNQIFERGVLNDVGTACFIKGQSAELLLKKGGPQSAFYRRMAIEAFKRATQYPYARTWDPKGFFWCPAEEASKHLNKLK